MKVRLALLAGGLSLIASPVFVAAQQGTAADRMATNSSLSSGPVRIDTGLLEGAHGRNPSIMVYKGIPYAAPPVGDLRFKAPQPPAAWQGVRKADEYGNSCPQSSKKEKMGEDCLFANVWTPAGAATERRPVFVWIYGGAFYAGSGSNIEFDGEALAKKGIVVVTFNYRLGALGFLATPELSREGGHNASGNFGLLDQVAMLQWVHRNIAAFGGDPNKVTIGGQSAGAGSVGFLSMSPLAKGLFIGGIQQSHARYSRDIELLYLSVSYRKLKDAEQEGEQWEQAHGAHSLAELRAKPWQDLVVAGTEVETSVDTGTDAKPPLFRPVVDGWVLPRNYGETFASRSQNDVAIIAGEDRDESGAVPENTFAARRAEANYNSNRVHLNLTVKDFVAASKRKFGPMTDEFLKLYPASNDDEAAMMNNESVRDRGRVSTYLWAKDFKMGTDKPVFIYYWSHRPTGDPLGAHHGSEILFVFNNLDLKPNKQPWTDQDRKLADTLSSYWVNFVTNGNPNGSGLPTWPQVDPKSPVIMEIGDHSGPIPVTTPERLSFWEKFFQTQPKL